MLSLHSGADIALVLNVNNLDEHGPDVRRIRRDDLVDIYVIACAVDKEVGLLVGVDVSIEMLACLGVVLFQDGPVLEALCIVKRNFL